jgi:hypothetical protein
VSADAGGTGGNAPLDRRRFVQAVGGLGLAGVAAGLAHAMGAAGDAQAQTGGKAPPAAPGAPGAAETPQDVKDEARRLLETLRARYGTNLPDADAAALGEALEGTVQSGRALRAQKLANAVEPDTIFRAVAPSPAPSAPPAKEGGR